MEEAPHAQGLIERQWWRSDKVPASLLEVPDGDLPTVVGCLALGTLYLLRQGVGPPSLGAVLASPRFREELRGRIPVAMISALNGMDELAVLRSSSTQHEAGLVDELIVQFVSALRQIRVEPYDLGWVPDDWINTHASPPVGGDREPGRYYEPVGEAELLRRIGSLGRINRRHSGEEWTTFTQLLAYFSAAHPVALREQLTDLTARGYLEARAGGEGWRVP